MLPTYCLYTKICAQSKTEKKGKHIEHCEEISLPVYAGRKSIKVQTIMYVLLNLNYSLWYH